MNTPRVLGQDLTLGFPSSPSAPELCHKLFANHQSHTLPLISLMSITHHQSSERLSTTRVNILRRRLV